MKFTYRVLVLIFLFSACSNSVIHAQEQHSSTDWLSLKFGVEEAQSMINAGGEKLDLYLFIAEYGAEVYDVAPKDISEYPDALSLTTVHPDVPPLSESMIIQGSFNAELYTFMRDNASPNYYRVGESSYLIKIASYEQLRAKFHNQQ